jgi:hypothetical protein
MIRAFEPFLAARIPNETPLTETQGRFAPAAEDLDLLGSTSAQYEGYSTCS